jgi:hypothetical protein
MGRTIADLRALRERLTERRSQAAYAVRDDLDEDGLYTLVTINGAILALDTMIEEGREDPDPE